VNRGSGEPETKDKTSAGRPLIVSVISMVIFLLGSVGLLLGIIAGVGLFLNADLLRPYVSTIVFWYVGGPCLILAGYNLWKGKKGAALLAALIVVFDSMSPLIDGSLPTSANVGMRVVLAWILDIATLVLLVAAWKHLR